MEQMSLRLARLRGPMEASSLQRREIGSEAEKEARSRNACGLEGTVGSVTSRDPLHLMERLSYTRAVGIPKRFCNERGARRVAQHSGHRDQCIFAAKSPYVSDQGKRPASRSFAPRSDGLVQGCRSGCHQGRYGTYRLTASIRAKDMRKLNQSRKSS